MRREQGEVRVGDVIEFRTDPDSSGIIVSMLDGNGDLQEMVDSHKDHKKIKALVIHQASDKKFATWKTSDLPPFVITFKTRLN